MGGLGTVQYRLEEPCTYLWSTAGAILCYLILSQMAKNSQEICHVLGRNISCVQCMQILIIKTNNAHTQEIQTILQWKCNISEIITYQFSIQVISDHIFKILTVIMLCFCIYLLHIINISNSKGIWNVLKLGFCQVLLWYAIVCVTSVLSGNVSY